MKKLILIAVLTIWWIIIPLLMIAHACFLSGQYISGLNKICIYQCYDGERAITIKSYQMCPISL